MKKSINFEKDLLALRFRVVLLFIFFGLFTLGLSILVFENNNSINWNFVLIISTISTFLSLLFLIDSIEIKANKLIFKNIYGLKIKEFDLKKTYSRKINRKNNTQKGGVLWILLGKKYSNLINLRFKSENDKKVINVNGQILTDKGLNELITKTKKQYIYQ